MYVLDANVFIEAARRYYAFDLVPQYWTSLIALAKSGQLLSIDRVKDEIDRGKDLLADWADTEFAQWFTSTDDADVVQAYGEIMVWGHSQDQFTEAAKAEFAQAENADAWVIAYARAKGCTVTTEEQFAGGVKRRIPIPNVCQGIGVPCVDTFRMLRDLGVKLG